MSDTKETESYTTVELTLDNDEIIECAILTVYEAAGKEYIALLPLDENLEPNEAGDVYLYQYNETEDGEPDLGNIEDDDEYEIAADAFDEWMDSQEFDESEVEEEFRHKTGRSHIFPVFFFYITNDQFSLRPGHCYIKKPSLFFDFLIRHRFLIRTAALICLDHKYRIKFQPFCRMHCHQIHTLCRIFFTILLL